MSPFPAADVTTDGRDREMKSGITVNSEADGKCARCGILWKYVVEDCGSVATHGIRE